MFFLRTLVFVLCLCLPLIAQDSEEIKGHLVLNGGGKRPASVMNKFIELSGGKDALILVVPTASELSDTGEYYQEQFMKEYGCTNVTPLKLTKKRHAKNKKIVALIEKAGGIWFSGGDQRRIIDVIKDTPVGAAISAAYRRGATLGGTSAGTACMSHNMITGDGEFDRMTADNVVMWEGLGFFPHAILDQHFIARGRQNRLISVTLENPELFGIGVDEGTAVWLKPDQTFEVVGEGWVQIFDARQAKVTRTQPLDPKITHLGAHKMTVHILQPGEGFDLKTGEILP
jgi:cyanophycinase